MLYGKLGRDYGRVHRYDVSCPAQAIKALSVTIKGFKQSFIDGGYYRVLIGGKTELDINETINPVSNKETIRIVPVVAGASGNGKIILGTGLILASNPLGALFSEVSFITAATFTSIGTSLIIGGVSQLLFSPQLQTGSSERAENRPSFIFNGAVNTTRQGNPVPICYGRMIVGSQVISAGLTVTQL